MIIFFLGLLSLLDLGLLAAVYTFYRKNIDYEGLLSDITEERTLLSKMQDELKQDISTFGEKSQSSLQKMTKLAAEVEQEIAHSEKTIAKSIDAIVDELAQKFEPMTTDINNHKNTLDILYRKVEREKIILQKLLFRLETLFKFFDEKIPYDEVLKEIEYKKYSDARFLLTQGYDSERIMKELGMNRAEVDIIRGTCQL